jgi:hypothetical protein
MAAVISGNMERPLERAADKRDKTVRRTTSYVDARADSVGHPSVQMPLRLSMEDENDLSGLSPEQVDTDLLLRRLLGTAIADRYADFCRLVSGALPLTVSRPLAGHALRELDSLIRYVLAVPMEARAEDSQEEVERRRKAKVALKALGFDQPAVQRACKELKPQYGHRTQIERIIERLGLARDGDVAKNWITLNAAYGRVHERSFHLSMKVDDDFRTEYAQRFDIVIRALMVQLEGRYAALMRRVEDIAAMAPAEGIKAFTREIPGAIPLQGHFYAKLTSEDWLPVLAQKGLLGEPLPDPRGDSGLRLWTWPVAEYLQRMAQSPNPATRTAVCEAVRALASSTHPDVRHRGMDIIGALPAKEASDLAEVVAGWLTPEALLRHAAPHALIAALARAGFAHAALKIMGATFQVFEREGRLATLFEDAMYEYHLGVAVSVLASTDKSADIIRLLCDLLQSAMRIEKQFSGALEEDYTYFSVRSLTSNDLDARGTSGALVGGIVTVIRAAVARARTNLAGILETLQSYRAKMYRRIALHALAMAPEAAADLAEACLTDTALIDADWCRQEYAELATAWFPSLSAAAQRTILDFVDAVPERFRETYEAHFEAHEKRPFTEDDDRKYRATTVRDIVWEWRHALPPARREALDATVAELGGPDAWRRHYFPAEESPLTFEAIQSQSIDDTVAFLDRWRPDPEAQSQTATALSNALRQSAAADAKTFSAHAEKFARLRPIFIRRLLEGLDQPIANGVAVAWGPVLALMSRILERAEVKSDILENVPGDDPDWSWTLRTMMDVLGSGLRGGGERLAHKHAESVRALVIAVYRRISMVPASEDASRNGRHLFYSAQRTPRGAAIELCLLLLWWLSKGTGGAIGRAPRDALALAPDIRAIFDTELADRWASAWIPRAILGRYLRWLFYFGEPWLRDRLSALFPPEENAVRRIAWMAHLQSDDGPLGPLLETLREFYLEQIRGLVGDASTEDNATSIRLAHYLMALDLQEELPEDLLTMFWEFAPRALRQRAMWYVGRHLISTEMPIRARAISYWDRRLALAMAERDPGSYRKELGTLGQFFLWNVDPEWLMDQLLRMLTAGFAPNDPIGIVDALAKHVPQATDRVVAIVNALVKHPQVNPWIFVPQAASLRRILVEGQRSSSVGTQRSCQEIVSLLASRGHTGFLDLSVP